MIDSDDDEDFLPDLQAIQPQLRQLLSIDNFNLLQDIVAERKENEGKWAGLTVADLFPDMLRDANLIARAFGGTNFVHQIRRRKATPQNKNPCSLVEACTVLLSKCSC